MDDGRWTLPQTLTWIIYRDRDRVHGVREKKLPASCMDVLNEATVKPTRTRKNRNVASRLARN